MENEIGKNEPSLEFYLNTTGLAITTCLYSISGVPFSAVKAKGALRQYDAQARSRTVPIRVSAFVKQAVVAKLSSFPFFYSSLHLGTSFREHTCR